MTPSLIYASIGYASLAVVAILDKFILSDKGETGRKETSPAVYTFYSTIFFLLLAACLPFSAVVKSSDIFYFVLSGISFGLGMWTMFISLKHGEASHIAPFIGAAVAVSTFLLSYFFLGEVFTNGTKIGLSLLVLSSLILSFEKSKKHNGFHVGFVWGILSGILFAISHVSAKYTYENYPFITSIIWTKGTVGLVGLLTLFLPSVRQTLFSKNKNKSGVIKSEPNVKESKVTKPKSNLFIILVDKIIGVVAVICIQYAISTGSVTIVNGLAGIQYVLMFIFIYSLTKLAPKLFSEYFTKQELWLEIIAILLSLTGLAFLS